MTRLVWGAPGERRYETGVDRGVLYLDGKDGVAWSGLTSVDMDSSGGEPRAYYIDGVKYLNISAAEEFAATIHAFTYPNEFSVCDGTARLHSGLFVTQQPRKSFGLTYRTRIGNDLSGSDYGYKIHLVYNALAAPSNRSYGTIRDSEDLSDFSWAITTRPPTMTGHKPTAHFEIHSHLTNPVTLAAIEDILYGTDTEPARLPSLDEVIAIFEANSILGVVDNGDGTFTVSGPDEMIQMLDATTFQITAETASYIEEDTYTISSL